MSEVSLKIIIAGAEYALKVKPEDEVNVNEAAIFLNDKIKEFEKNYPVIDKKDILAMVSLQMVTEFLKKDKEKSEELLNNQKILDELNLLVKTHQEKINQ